MTPQGITVDLVMWLLKDSQAKYNQELKTQYQTRIKDIENEVRDCLKTGTTNVTVDNVTELLLKIMVAKGFDPPAPEVDWDLINSTLSGLPEGVIQWDDLPLSIQRQIELLAFLDHPAIHQPSSKHSLHHAFGHTNTPPERPTITPCGSEDGSDNLTKDGGSGKRSYFYALTTSDNLSEDDEEYFDTSENSSELARKFADIRLPTHIDNSLGDGSNSTVENDENSPVNSKDGWSTPKPRSYTPDTWDLHEQQRFARKESIDSDEMCDQFEGADSAKENRPPQGEQRSTTQHYMGQPEAQVLEYVVCEACGIFGALRQLTLRPGHGPEVVTDVGAAIPFQIYEDEEDRIHHPHTTTKYMGQMNINEESQAMGERDSDEESNFQPQEFKRPEYQRKAPRPGGGRIRATLAGSPIQKRGPFDSEDMNSDGFGNEGHRGHGGRGHGGAGIAGVAPVMLGAGHGAPIPALSGEYSVLARPSDEMGKKRKRTDTNQLFN